MQKQGEQFLYTLRISPMMPYDGDEHLPFHLGIPTASCSGQQAAHCALLGSALCADASCGVNCHML